MNPPAPQLQEGSDGRAVVSAQALLVSHGFTSLKVDGVFGPITAGTTRAFQQREGLADDAVIGPLTWGKLISGA